MTYQTRMADPDCTTSQTAPVSAPIYDARRIVGENDIAMIVLDEKAYTLRITRAGKLILTK